MRKTLFLLALILTWSSPIAFAGGGVFKMPAFAGPYSPMDLACPDGREVLAEVHGKIHLAGCD